MSGNPRSTAQADQKPEEPAQEKTFARVATRIGALHRRRNHPQQPANGPARALEAPRQSLAHRHDVALAAFMEVLDTSIANVALPHIAGSLGASTDEGTWVLTSYLVSNAIVLPLGGWASSVLAAATSSSSASSFYGLQLPLWRGLSLPMLLLFRVLQGAGGGGLHPWPRPSC